MMPVTRNLYFVLYIYCLTTTPIIMNDELNPKSLWNVLREESNGTLDDLNHNLQQTLSYGHNKHKEKLVQVEYHHSIITRLVKEYADEYGNTVVLTYGKCHPESPFLGMLIARFEIDTLVACTRITTGMYPFFPERRTRYEEFVVLLPGDILRLYLESLSDETMYDSRRSNKLLLIGGISFKEFEDFENRYPVFNMEYLKVKVTQKVAIGLMEIVRTTIPSKLDSKTEFISSMRPNNMIQNIDTMKTKKLKAVRVVTVFFAPFVLETPMFKQKCGIAVECQIPDRQDNGTVKWRIGCCTGIVVDIFERIRHDLGFKYTLYVVEDGKWGSQEQDGRWNGMIGDLLQNKADVALNLLSIIQKRAEVVEFAEPFMHTSYGIYRIKKPGVLKFPSWDFMTPLSEHLRWAIIGTCIFALLVIFALENHVFMRIKADTKYFPFRESMTYVFGLTFQRDMGGTNPRMWSGRLAALGYASGMVVIMSIYTAMITANTIITEVDDGFRGFKDEKLLNPTPEYKFSIEGGIGSGQEEFFQHNTDEHFRRMYHFMKGYFVRSPEEGIKALLNGSLQGFIADIKTTDLLLSATMKKLVCAGNIKTHNDTVLNHGLGLAYRKNFTYGRTISNVILRISQEPGFVEQVERKWTLGSCPKNIQPAQFGWMYFSSFLLIVAGGVAFGFIANLVEYFLFGDKLRPNSLTTQTKIMFQANRALQKQFHEYDERKVHFGQSGTYMTASSL
ncbi:glutamate receptor ionotropic, NMDA 1-like [Clytia hemisphaerica]|uniref:Uncharacterized protein n=1 Tax=Clytia hemisphaerica TaxID=252671 RepID=A0A7M6DQL5_9CNID